MMSEKKKATPSQWDGKAVIKSTDMSEEMQGVVVDLAIHAMEQYNIEKDIAAHIKKELDYRFGTAWHSIVGRHFGSYVTHETGNFLYFYLGQIAFLIFKS
ncbi:dynein light chain type 1-domain-containing protein [Dipodascopsis tothii]|uniref:dynein light chain type 1-domain-containing protein n=1 Tax=Dipodascopsis tothii TaxID=44089 RepID=UPI0034CD6A24